MKCLGNEKKKKDTVLFLFTVHLLQPRTTWAESLNWGLSRSGRPARACLWGAVWTVWIGELVGTSTLMWVKHSMSWAWTVYEWRNLALSHQATWLLSSISALGCACNGICLRSCLDVSSVMDWNLELQSSSSPKLLFGQSNLITATEMNPIFIKDSNSRHFLRADLQHIYW